jgi:signal transduction histidine kinase
MADFDKTVWVMNNFLTNAVKHSFQDEGIRILVENTTLSFSSALSIPEAVLMKNTIARSSTVIFRFPGEHQNGTGLGLAISKTLLRNRMVKLG